jgi:CDP-diacylglycerol---glycerol-3-phosphate 3-phosphatidyltransferase
VYNISLILTLIRLFFSPLVLPFILFYGWSSVSWESNILLAAVFILLSLTDFFDGYFARKYRMETKLGRDLDPIADKVLIFSALTTILAIGKLHFFWVILFVGREFFVMGLRIIGLENNVKIDVSRIAKVKTAVQMIFITVSILSPMKNFNTLNFWTVCELILLASAVFLSIFTAYKYFQSFSRACYKK